MIRTIFPMFFTPSVATLARRELEDAERALLQAQSNVEYATNMAAYHRARAVRLKGYVAEIDRAAKVEAVRYGELSAT